MDTANKRFLIHVRIGGDRFTTQRLQEVAVYVQETLSRISGGDCQLAYTSSDGGTFGFLIATKKHANAILRALESPHEGRHDPEAAIKVSALLGGDMILIVELGDDYAERHLGKAGTWLHHHSSST